MSGMHMAHADLHTVLQERFGFEAFRPGQEQVIRSLLAGRDVLAVLPTGGGKSLPFQLAAQLLPGVTVVVSPLIALMKDQADSIQSHGLEVGVLNSHQPADRMREDMEKVEGGDTKLLYVTPERLEKAEFAESLPAPVSQLVVDEAHCVSEWGYDFRPAFLGIREAAARLGRPPVLALTATATPWVRRDLIERLALRDPDVVVHGVDRPNLFLENRTVQREEEDFRVLRSLLLEEPEEYPKELSRSLRAAMEGSGIIYVATTRAAEETAGWLRDWGITADFYHGGRKKADRERVQDAFMAGEVRVIAATNAFGLGVDKPDVRFVIHRDVPASVEEYYQEAGRAGRDGEFARCTLIFRSADLGRAAFLSASARLTPEELASLRKAFVGREEVSPDELAEETGLSRGKLRRALSLLEREGVLQEESGLLRLTNPDFDPERISLESEESRRAYERSRLQMMRRYAEAWDCRRAYLLGYFGQDTETERCGQCDNCTLTTARGETADEPLAFALGTRVAHAKWGEGEVLELSAETITVRFDSEGEKKLGRSLVEEQGLLELVTPAEERKATPAARPDADEVALPFSMGERVVHESYGAGEVQHFTHGSVTVLFDKAGYHTLDTELVRERGLLTTVDEDDDEDETGDG